MANRAVKQNHTELVGYNAIASKVLKQQKGIPIWDCAYVETFPAQESNNKKWILF